MLDMTALKFFSTPPRALLAMSDPKELEGAHQMFVDAITNPNKQKCLINVMCPQNMFYKGLKALTTDNKKRNVVHPIVYNSYHHYGNMSTAPKKLYTNADGSTPFDVDFFVEGVTEEENSAAQQAANIKANQEADKIYLEGITFYGSELVKAIGSAEIGNMSGILEEYAILKNTLLYQINNYTVEDEENVVDLFIDIVAQTWSTLAKQTAQKNLFTISSIVIPNLSSLKEELISSAASFAPTVSSDIGWNHLYHSMDGVINNPISSWEDYFDNSDIFDFGTDTSLLDLMNQFLQSIEFDARAQAIQAYNVAYNKAYDEEYNNYANIAAGAFTSEVIENYFIRSDNQLKNEANKSLKNFGLRRPQNVDMNSFFDIKEFFPATADLLYDGDNLTSRVNMVNRLTIDPLQKEKIKGLSIGKNIPGFQQFVEQEFLKDTKAPYLQYLTIHPDILFRPDKFGGTFKYQLAATTSGVEDGLGLDAKTFVNSRTAFAGNLGNNAHAHRWSQTRKTWPLDTVLKDISADPLAWQNMFHCFIGCSHRSDMFNAQDHLFLDHMLPTMLEDDPDSVYTSFDDHAQAQFPNLIGNSFGFTAIYNSLRISPGYRKILNMAIERREQLGADSEIVYSKGGKYRRPMLTAFLDLTLAEATGLTNDRIRKFFPNIVSPTLSAVGLILSYDHSQTVVTVPFIYGDTFSYNYNPLTYALEELTSISSINDLLQGRTHRAEDGGSLGDGPEAHNEASFTPSYLVVEKVFRDPESILSAEGDALTDHFSMNKNKVNPELYSFFEMFPIRTTPVLQTLIKIGTLINLSILCLFQKFLQRNFLEWVRKKIKCKR